MIDYLLLFADEATAKADPVIGLYFIPPIGNFPGGWRGDSVIPNVQAWHPSQDVSTPITVPGGGTVNQITHTFLPGFYMVIAKPAHDAALDAHSAAQFVLDRDAGNQAVKFTGNIIGTTLNVASVQGGTIQIGQKLSGTHIPAGATIISGSGNSWKIDRVPPQAVSGPISGVAQFVVQTAIPSANLPDFMWQPCYLGSTYPFGNTALMTSVVTP